MSLFVHGLGKRKNNAMEEKQTHFCNGGTCCKAEENTSKTSLWLSRNKYKSNY